MMSGHLVSKRKAKVGNYERKRQVKENNQKKEGNGITGQKCGQTRRRKRHIRPTQGIKDEDKAIMKKKNRTDKITLIRKCLVR
jgi:hypothetical protein